MITKANTKNKRIFFLFANIVLVITIVFVAYQKFLKGYEELTFDCSYNSEAPELIELIRKNFKDVEGNILKRTF